MNLDIEKKENIVFIKAKSDLNFHFTKNFDHEIDNFQKNGDYLFVFDLENCDWIDSVGIQCILNTAKISKQHGFKTVIINCNYKIKDIFNILGVEEFIELKENIEEAIEYFGK